MAVNELNSALIKRMFLAGVVELEANKEWINELNVFPVPDGDTGTNMTLTILSAAREVGALEDNPEMKDLAKAISSGSLRGARGNSGVIMSQLFRGFTKEIRQYDTIDIPILAAALTRATETAYKAVMKPKEGTILTVARGISERGTELAEHETDLESFIRELIAEGDRQLARTPDLLPVLKEAGVVDSGGQGLMQFLKGALAGFLGKEVRLNENGEPISDAESAAETVEEELKYLYCVTLTAKTDRPFSPIDERELADYLNSIGDGTDIYPEPGCISIHIHTNNPGLAVERALQIGELKDIRILNRGEETCEHTSFAKSARTEAAQTTGAAEEPVIEETSIPEKPYGFISVSAGAGLSEIFKSLGVDYIIEGGQTMNPSTEDMLNAIEQVHAKSVFILPNNKNIILAANQAQSLVENKTVYVVPTKTIPQGITALINFNPEVSPEENAEVMKEEIANVKSGQVTYAIRDTVIDGIEIHKDDIIGLGDKTILADGNDVEDVTFRTIEAMMEESTELISLYYGCDVPEEQAAKLAERINEAYPSVDVEMNRGDQPIYYYIISTE